MKLRARLACTVLIAAVPVVAAIVWLRARYEWKTAEQALVEYARDRLEFGGREACEEDPSTFSASTRPRGGPGGPGPRDERGPRDEHGPPPKPPNDGFAHPPLDSRGPPMRSELWAYARDFRSANPNAPQFPDDLRGSLASGAYVASSAWKSSNRRGIQVALRTDWSDGPCAFVLARRADLGPPGAVGDLVWGSVALSLALLAAVLFAAGPIVERVRRLTGQVRQSAAARYATPASVGGADEVTELASAFNVAAAEVRSNLDALEAREKTLRTFLENTLHDLMLPLTVLQGHLTTLRRKAKSGAAAEPQLVVDALQETHYIASLIQNLSAAARLESNTLAFERHRVDLNALVERAVGRHAPIASASNIALEHAVPPSSVWIEGDVTLVEQAVSNLIHNAVRYVEPGGHVAVVLEEHGADFVLRVLDDGPGIPPELETKVFERSFRADAARSRHPAGLGLGLSIAKFVADRHDFTLTLRRPESGGAEVELRGQRVAAAP